MAYVFRPPFTPPPRPHWIGTAAAVAGATSLVLQRRAPADVLAPRLPRMRSRAHMLIGTATKRRRIFITHA